MRLLKIFPKGFLVAVRSLICSVVGLFCIDEKVCTAGGAHGYPREAFKREWFEKSIMLQFESEEFCAPAGWDEILTNMYGDYMTPPKEDDRCGHFI